MSFLVSLFGVATAARLIDGQGPVVEDTTLERTLVDLDFMGLTGWAYRESPLLP
jgi:hypothetical protein